MQEKLPLFNRLDKIQELNQEAEGFKKTKQFPSLPPPQFSNYHILFQEMKIKNLRHITLSGEA